MTTVPLTGQGIMIPPGHYNATMAPSFSNVTFDATGDKVAMIGRVWEKDRGASGTKAIRRIQFRWGAVTKAGGSGITLSIQDVDTANGPIIRPDGTPDQTVAIAAADVTASTWHRSNALSADRTVSHGDLIAVVFEFDGGGRLGADSYALAGVALSSGVLYPVNQQGAFVNYDGATWAFNNVMLNIVLEFSDGTYGTLQGALPASAINTHAFNSGSTPDEYAMKLTPEWECDIDAIGAGVAPATGANFDMVLYSGTTVEQTVSVDQNATINTSVRPTTLPIPLENLAANSDYYISVKPTTTNNVTVYSFDVNDVAFLDLLGPWGNEMTYATRTDSGSWTETTTRRLFAWAQLAGVPSAAGGSNVIQSPNMRGGFIN